VKPTLWSTIQAGLSDLFNSDNQKNNWDCVRSAESGVVFTFDVQNQYFCTLTHGGALPYIYIIYIYNIYIYIYIDDNQSFSLIYDSSSQRTCYRTFCYNSSRTSLRPFYVSAVIFSHRHHFIQHSGTTSHYGGVNSRFAGCRTCYGCSPGRYRWPSWEVVISMDCGGYGCSPINGWPIPMANMAG